MQAAPRTVVPERAVRRQVDVVLLAVLHEVVLEEQRVRLDLVRDLPNTTPTPHQPHHSLLVPI